MNKNQSAVLTLENYYLTANVVNNLGTINGSKSNMSWSNINLRTLLGDMWDKYEYFNLSLTEISTAPSPSSNAPSGSTITQNIYITGLPFINATYDTQLKLNTNKCLLTTFNFGTANNPATKLYNGTNNIIFRKEQEQCDITIYYNSIGTSTIPLTVSFPNTTFIFNIQGVQIDKDINTKSRMIN